MAKRLAPADPAATEHYVIIVKNGRLPWSDGSLRFVQANTGAMVLQRRHCRARTRMAITDLDRDFDFAVITAPKAFRADRVAGITDSGYRVPVCALDFEFATNQIVCIADDDAIRFRIKVENVTRP